MWAIGLDVGALGAVANLGLNGAHGAGKVLMNQDLLQRHFVIIRAFDPFHLGPAEAEPEIGNIKLGRLDWPAIQ